MSKLKNKKAAKSHLTTDQRKDGKNHVYILLGMVVIGIFISLYYIR